jgi:streptomycin 6-kinase
MRQTINPRTSEERSGARNVEAVMNPKSIDEADDGGVLNTLLTRHKLTVEGANLAQHGSALVYVVRDEDGQLLVIKDGGRRYGGSEDAWLRAHASHPGVVDVVDRLGEFLLLRWVPGTLLAHLPSAAARHARAAGELLGSLDRPPDPATASLSRRIIIAGRRLPHADTAAIQHCHERLTAGLAARAVRDRSQWSYLHADFHPRNLILSAEGLVVIDPFGLAGPPAWDLAQFAAIAYGGAQLDEPPPLSHDAILTQLVAGFGRTPALLEEMAAYWLILVHRMRHKLGVGLGSWLDTVAEEYSRRRPCRRQRYTCCA